MGKKTNYKEGDLIRIIEHNGWTLGSLQLQQSGELVVRECPLQGSQFYQPSFRDSYNYFEGKVGLVLKVIRNRLDQPVGYRVQTGEYIWFCKSVVARKYFESAGEQTYATGTVGEI
jgi:hypothetical protein